MLHYLSEEAVQDFFELTIMSLEHGIIGKTIYLERLARLADIGRSDDEAVKIAKEILARFEWPFDIGGDGYSGGDGERERNLSKGSPPGDEDNQDDKPTLHFMTNIGGDNWIFHPGDDDFFPSVPHGHNDHKKTQNNIKLDPYLGWKYKKSTQCGRISRKEIISLWNEKRFRGMASTAIDYYLAHHPHYSGWRVHDPRLLPRRRK